MSEQINNPIMVPVNNADQNMADSYSQRITVEKQVLFSNLLNEGFDNENLDGYRVGLLTFFGGSVAFISSEYASKFSKENGTAYETDTVMFFPKQTKFVPENVAIQTYKNLYVIKYMPGGTVINEKTGSEQKTINYEFPIEVLYTIDRKKCTHVRISDSAVIYNCAGDTANNISEVTHSVSTVELEENQREKIRIELIKETEPRGFFFASSFPSLLNKVGIKDFHEYSGSVNEFIEKYFSDTFYFGKNYEIDGKIHPGVIIRSDKSIVPAVVETSKENIRTIRTDLDTTVISGITDQLLKVLEANGFVLASMFPSIAQNNGLNDYKVYAENVSDFISRYLSEKFHFEQNYEHNGKRYPGVILPSPSKDISLTEERIKISELPREIEAIQDCEFSLGVINMCTPKSGFINAEYVDKTRYKSYVQDTSKSVIFSTNGVTTIPENEVFKTTSFVYLVRYVTRGTVKNSKTGAEQPAFDYSYPIQILKSFPRGKCAQIRFDSDEVIIKYVAAEKNETGRSVSHKENTEILRKEVDCSIFDCLFDDEKYVEILSSEILKKTNFCDLPVNYMEMVLTCAARLLFPWEKRTVSLNMFQREVIASSDAYSFIKKWKKDGKFSEELIAACAESSFADFTLPTDNGNVAKLINQIGYTNAHNDNYAGLTSMFSVCHDSLLPYLLLVRVYVQRSHATLTACISEYCQIVKDIKKSSDNSKISEDNKSLYLTEFIKTVYRMELIETELPQNIRTNIASVYMDINKFDVFSELLQYLDPFHTSNDAKIVRLHENIETCRENDIMEILTGNVNLQLFQKCIALAWERYDIEVTLPLQFLQVLNWICEYSDSTMIDEILRYHFSSIGNKENKQVQLILSYPDVCRAVDNNTSMYALAAYIYYVVYATISDSKKLQDEIVAPFASWNEFSSKVVHSVMSAYTPITIGNESEFVKLFGIFSLDDDNQLLLQKEYAKWYLNSCMLSERSEKEICTILDELFIKRAYGAFVEVYNYFADICVSRELIDAQIEHDIDSLIALRRFSEAIDSIQMNYEINNETTNRLLIKVVTENFRCFGISPRAYAAFSKYFTCGDAISLLENNIHPNQMYVFTDLLALYCYKNDYTKALYLYETYQGKAENGFTRLYSQFRGKTKNINGKLHNHNDVIRLAFYALDPNALIDFLDWTKHIPVPTFKGYNSTHAFSYYYDKIRVSPRDHTLWAEFLSQLSKRRDINSWDIIVCESVVKVLSGNVGTSNHGLIIREVIQKADIADLPYNFLPYCYSYIMEYDDSSLCKDITSLISSKTVAGRLFDQNLWLDSYSALSNRFKSFCVDTYGRTGDRAYYNLLTALGMELNENDMLVIAQSSGEKSYLFSQICQNYLNGEKKAETINIINSINQRNLSRRDKVAFDAIKILYEDDNRLLNGKNSLFIPEENVGRIKHDIAEILSTYPKLKGLLSFEEACTNEVHKLTVYSYVFGAVYDEEIKERKPVPFIHMIRDDTYYRAFLTFSSKVYWSQLDWNEGYQFFYHKWRYLKMFTSGFLLSDGEYDGDEIISEMRINGHYDSVYGSDFVPFRDSIHEFWSISELGLDEKKEFLLSLMLVRLGDFFQNHSEAIRMLPKKRKDLLRRLIGIIDYREANLSLYQLFLDDFENNSFKTALEAAEAISEFSFEAISAVGTAVDTKKAVDLLKDTALIENPAGVVGKILSLDDAVLDKNPTLLMAILFSRQLSFQAFGYIRYIIVQNSKNVSWVFLNVLSRYVSSKMPDATAICMYLQALKACKENNREVLSRILSSHDITRGIPTQWSSEVNLIIDFANGKTVQFKPDVSIKDSSEIGEAEEISFSFLDKLKDVFGTRQEKLSISQAEEYYEHYINETSSLWERIQAGVTLAVNYPNVKDSKLKELSLPTKNDLILSVGLDSLVPEINLPSEDRIQVLTELYNARSIFDSSANHSLFIRLNDVFLKSVNHSLPLRIWTEYCDSIGDVLKVNHLSSDFDILSERIIKPCAALYDPEVTVEDRYYGLQKLLSQSKGLNSVYASNVFTAIKGECIRIERGTRLSVSIVNYNHCVTDGYVYFQINNTGKRSVMITPPEFSILMDQDGHPQTEVYLSSICDLQSGSITGGRAKLSLDGSEVKVHVRISIVHRGKDNESEIISSCKTEDPLVVEASENAFRIRKRQNQYNVETAVLDSSMLFGREGLKDDLEYMIPTGVTVIYGPSRIGKTSLMNWIRNDLAKEHKNVLSILFGGEGALGKESDYNINFKDAALPIKYNDDAFMADYLLVQTILQSLSLPRMEQRLSKPYGTEFTPNMRSEMISILAKQNTGVLDKYGELDTFLKDNGLELWLMLDEFQQVIEKNWRPDLSSEFVQACKMLSYNGRSKNIKLIICGSDDLLRHMVLEDESVWRVAFPKNSRISVEPLDPKSFADMIQQDYAVSGTNIIYSRSAQDALYAYTDGVALYGKEICNSIISDIADYPYKYENRNVLYAYDVAEATQHLLDDQTTELNTDAKEGVREIYDAVTKNLQQDTDMQYLWYIAIWISTHKDQEGFPENEFLKMENLRDVKEMNDTISIAMARNIIKKKSSENSDRMYYVFRTIFYYYAFLGSGSKPNSFDKTLIIAPETFETEVREKNASQVVADYFSLPDEERDDALDKIWRKEPNDAIRSSFRESFFPPQTIIKTDGGDIVQGTKIGTQINAQTINTAFNTLLTGESSSPAFLEAIQHLPTMQAYLGESQKQKLVELNEQVKAYQADYDAAETPEEVIEAKRQLRETEAQIEELTASGEQQMLSDTVGAVVASDDFTEISNERWIELLGIENQAELDRIHCLPTEFVTPLGFAVMLHNVFDKIGQKIQDGINGTERELDFCPVAIMYCKVVEAMLKKLHTPLYIAKIGNDATLNRGGKRFIDLLDSDGVTIHPTKELTIGSFAFNIANPGRDHDIDQPERFTSNPKKRIIRQITGRSDDMANINQQWFRHAQDIDAILAIRNRSAHEAIPITKNNFEWLIRILFENGELLRIASIAEECS